MIKWYKPSEKMPEIGKETIKKCYDVVEVRP